MFGFSLYALTLDDRMFTWWAYVLLFIGPDISMIGYLFGNKPGAVFYNIFHHKGIALLLIFAGMIFSVFPFLVCGIILFGHSSLDRIMGYGLKYFTGFSDTHLGRIGKV